MEGATTEIEKWGFRFTPMTLETIVATIEARWADRMPTTILYQNLHTMYIQTATPEFAECFADPAESLAVVDGLPIVHLLNLAGHNLDANQRATAVDLLHPILQAAALSQRPVFVIGQEDTVLHAAMTKLRATHPRLIIDGHHGYFDTEGPCASDIIEAANSFGADLVLVGLGTPKGEVWIHHNRSAFDAPVVWACGALMEYVSGAVPTPPRWAGPMGLEWLFRLAHDPSRFLKRYFFEPPVLLARIIRSKVSST